MKKILGLFVSMVIVSACALTSKPSSTEDICDIFKEKRSWYKAAKKTEKRWNIPISVTMAIVKQESSFIRDAKPNRKKLFGFIPWKRQSSAKGYAQAIDGTWDMYLKEKGAWFKSRSNFDHAVDFIGWYNSKSVEKLKIKKTDAKALYLAYHEGRSGYKNGSYKAKPWLLTVAEKVQKQSDKYNDQYLGCKKKLGRNFFILS